MKKLYTTWPASAINQPNTSLLTALQGNVRWEWPLGTPKCSESSYMVGSVQPGRYRFVFCVAKKKKKTIRKCFHNINRDYSPRPRIAKLTAGWRTRHREAVIMSWSRSPVFLKVDVRFGTRTLNRFILFFFSTNKCTFCFSEKLFF